MMPTLVSQPVIADRLGSRYLDERSLHLIDQAAQTVLTMRVKNFDLMI